MIKSGTLSLSVSHATYVFHSLLPVTVIQYPIAI